MSYFDKEKNVKDYIRMMEGFDNEFMMEEVFSNLPIGKKMLELGIGAGHDLEILKKSYDITGTDKSQVFLNEYRKRDSETPLIRMDAVKMDIDEKFDYIYSNKVLIHLTDKELKESFKNQLRVLKKGGLVFHSFWKGSKSEKYHGLLFNYKTRASILKITKEWYEEIKYMEYKEIAKNDSFYIILKKK